MKELLKLKEKMKAKKPKFTRTDSHKKGKLNRSGWRKPKGLHNKMRLQIRGYKRVVKEGYRTPRKIRGLEKDGKKIILISTISQLKNLEKEAKVMISSNVGAKKKIEIIEQCQKDKIEVANFKDLKKWVEQAKDKLLSRKKEGEDKKEKRTKKKDEAEKKAKEKEKEKDKEKTVEEKVDEEEKKIQDKKEKDKFLISKE